MRLFSEILKNLEEWKLTSGAFVMCLVTYSDGKEVQDFQLVLLSASNNKPLNLSTLHWGSSQCRKFVYQYLQGMVGGDTWKLQRMGSETIWNWWIGFRWWDSGSHPKAKNIRFERDGRGKLILPLKLDLKIICEKQRVTSAVFFFTELNHRIFHWESKGCFSLHADIERLT